MVPGTIGTFFQFSRQQLRPKMFHQISGEENHVPWIYFQYRDIHLIKISWAETAFGLTHTLSIAFFISSMDTFCGTIWLWTKSVPNFFFKAPGVVFVTILNLVFPLKSTGTKYRACKMLGRFILWRCLDIDSKFAPEKPLGKCSNMACLSLFVRSISNSEKKKIFLKMKLCKCWTAYPAK